LRRLHGIRHRWPPEPDVRWRSFRRDVTAFTQALELFYSTLKAKLGA
jgi:hypothetical protein